MMTEAEGEKTEIIRAVFDALPSRIFIVDRDVQIVAFNAAAAELLTEGSETEIRQRAGEVLHCLHAADVPEGCGRAPFCANCVIRHAVMEAFQGNRVVRRRTRMELVRQDTTEDLYALITATPFVFAGEGLALLVIEDISEIAELHRLIPICIGCHKLRDDKDVWLKLEAYFKRNWDVDFTHGYCPDCFKKELEKVNVRAAAKGERTPEADDPIPGAEDINPPVRR